MADNLRSFSGGKLRSERDNTGEEMLPERGGGCKGVTEKCFLTGNMKYFIAIS